ncbi:MAG: hypothetical protein OWU33_06315 [Firmicutes bacterium]|nr:hypothetical protein [Bacillota bacterium]
MVEREGVKAKVKISKNAGGISSNMPRVFHQKCQHHFIKNAKIISPKWPTDHRQGFCHQGNTMGGHRLDFSETKPGRYCEE